ncbi:MAG: DUF5625 family protein [Campylobacteraceae bacterium]|jgi:hypothetical protein|nr:DUF5625 family protein [Campylobacteraceae bacterium]
MNIKNTLLAIVGFIPFLSGCSNLPLEVPIDLSKAGNVVEFEAVVTSDNYTANPTLLFYVPDYVTKNPQGETEVMRQRREVYDFLGESQWKQNGKIGEVFPIHLSIHKLTKTGKELIVDKVIETKGNDGGWGGQYTRRLGWYELNKGKYIVRFETLKDIEFLRDKKCTIYFGRRVQKV